MYHNEGWYFGAKANNSFPWPVFKYWKAVNLVDLSKGLVFMILWLSGKFQCWRTLTPSKDCKFPIVIGILLILGACRRATEGIEAAKEGGWKWSADYLIGKQLTGTRLGILGMGRIGKKIAKIAKSLGMIIHYHNRSKLSAEKENGAIYHDSLKSLFSVSDVL